MHASRWKVHAAVLSLGLLAALAPVTFAGDQGLSAASAECTSCCKEMQSKCIKCTEDCIEILNAYDKGIGSCTVAPIAPVTPG